MNVKYLGTRINRRDARGRESGKRYRYSSGQPVFTIDDRDAIQFRGELEDGNPKFCVGYGEPQPITESTGASSHLVAISKLTVKQLAMALPRLTNEELVTLLGIEASMNNRATAIAAIRQAIG